MGREILSGGRLESAKGKAPQSSLELVGEYGVDGGTAKSHLPFVGADNEGEVCQVDTTP